MIVRHKLSLLVIFFTMLCAIQHVSAEILFHVELIVMEHKQSHQENENLVSYPVLFSLERTQILSLAVPVLSVNETPIVKLGSSYRLKPTSSIIKRSQNFRCIYHVAWIQSLTKGCRTKPVHIQGGKILPLVNDPCSDYQLEVEGILSLKYLHRLFYLHMDFVFRKFEDKGDKVHIFQSSYKARLKQKELYYFDHPKFGLFLMIVPIKR